MKCVYVIESESCIFLFCILVEITSVKGALVCADSFATPTKRYAGAVRNIHTHGQWYYRMKWKCDLFCGRMHAIISVDCLIEYCISRESGLPHTTFSFLCFVTYAMLPNDLIEHVVCFETFIQGWLSELHRMRKIARYRNTFDYLVKFLSISRSFCRSIILRCDSVTWVVALDEAQTDIS